MSGSKIYFFCFSFLFFFFISAFRAAKSIESDAENLLTLPENLITTRVIGGSFGEGRCPEHDLHAKDSGFQAEKHDCRSNLISKPS